MTNIPPPGSNRPGTPPGTRDRQMIVWLLVAVVVVVGLLIVAVNYNASPDVIEGEAVTDPVTGTTGVEDGAVANPDATTGGEVADPATTPPATDGTTGGATGTTEGGTSGGTGGTTGGSTSP
jgi:hypothetical protein